MNTNIRQIGALLATAALLLVPALPLRAQPADFETQPLEEISQTAIDHALSLLDQGPYKDIQASTRPMDERLRLRRCDAPLEASVNVPLVKPGRTSVSVRCSGSAPWSLFVPVTISAMVEVVVLKGPLPRGTVVLRQHVELRDMPVDQLPPNYLSDLDSVLGRELNRFVNNESFATAYMLKVRNLVEKGQEVVIQAGSSRFEVKVAGIAMEPGQLGDRISVKNPTSGKTVQGRIADAGTIVVSL